MFIDFRRILALVINAALLLTLAAAQQSDSASAGGTQTNTQTRTDRDQRETNGDGRWQQQRRFNAFAKSLKLTPEQRWRIVQIQRETTEKITAVRQDSSLNEEQMKQKIHELHSQQHQKTIALLNAEQQEALKKWTAEHKPAAKNSAVTSNGSETTEQEKAKEEKETDDEFFAGMTQDPEPQPLPAQRSAAKTPKN